MNQQHRLPARSGICRISLVLLLLSPSVAYALPAEVLGARGILAYRAGDLDGAVKLLSEAVRKRPSLVSAAHHLGLALVRQGKTLQGRRVLSAASRRDPQNVRLLLDLGLAYLAEGNKVWAVRTLRRARQLAPGDGRIRHFLGTALVGMGAAEEAVPELRRASALPHAQKEESAMQLGLALYRSKRFEDSRRQLDTLLSTPTHGRMARQLLRAAYEADGISASMLSLEFSSGLVLDSNPLYLAELAEDAQASHERAVSPGLMLAGRFKWRPLVGHRQMLWGDLSLMRTFYFGEYQPVAGGSGSSASSKNIPDPTGASPSLIAASAHYARRFEGRQRSWWLTAGYAFGLTFLDGEALTDDSYIFLESHGGQVSLELRRQSGPTSRLAYRLTRDVYFQRPRNNWGNELSAEHEISLLSDRMRLLIWALLRYEHADADHYRAVIPGGGVGLSWLAPLDLVLGLRLAYQFETYPVSEDGPWREHRRDHDLATTAELGRALPWGLRARAVYRFFTSASTVGTFRTNRHLFNLNLSWSYQ